MTQERKRLTVALHVHISAADAARLDELVVRYPTTKAAVARRALELGMRMLESDPAAFAEHDVTTDKEEPHATEE